MDPPEGAAPSGEPGNWWSTAPPANKTLILVAIALAIIGVAVGVGAAIGDSDDSETGPADRNPASSSALHLEATSGADFMCVQVRGYTERNLADIEAGIPGPKGANLVFPQTVRSPWSDDLHLGGYVGILFLATDTPCSDSDLGGNSLDQVLVECRVTRSGTELVSTAGNGIATCPV